VMFRNPGHMMVMDGYREQGGKQYIHVLDPDQPPDCERWQDYSTQTIDGHWPGPASAPDVVSDEASVATDTDGDGIVDFDEINRFSTSDTDWDSDGDSVADKRDMREYVFDATGAYSYRRPDWDGDGLRKEVDPDNDDGGAEDGCEDGNHNGVRDASETDNFDGADDVPCEPVLNAVYTTDFLGTPKTAFRPGEAIKMTMLASNPTTATIPVTFPWSTYDPNGTKVNYLSFDDWATGMPPVSSCTLA